MPAESSNLTLRLNSQTVRKAKVIAARRASSVSRLVTEQIEALVDDDERYEQAKARALARLDKGFAMGGKITAARSELHER